ncbi:nuclease-related domain-containing protein [Nocardioides sp. T5]|uniref:nuclease-related domain-containing protein n=1 Tax=Nocardioides sp. T5 TaxID=3400182 RepID=UPI003A87D613
MDDTSAPAEKRMRLRYAGTCRICDAALPAKAEAVYEPETKTVRCLAHDRDEPELDLEVDIGAAGSSARREFERRKAGREKRIRDKHPKLGGLILALSDDPQSTTAWNTGAIGEERLAGRLNSLQSNTCRILHDRRIPGGRANIDHLAVTPTGVHVIDAKRYSGRPQLRIEGGLLRPRVERLIVGRRDCTKLVDGVLNQVEVVRAVVGDQIPVHGVLCFVDADWPLIGGAFTTRNIQVLWPKRLQSALGSLGALDAHAIERAHRELARALPSA